MKSKSSDEFISNRAWFRNIFNGEDTILRGLSALEYLQLFVGYVGENEIEVYARNKGQYDNVHYHIISDFSEIDYIEHNGILCSTANQAFNDLMADYDNIDEQALVEALSKYYYNHNMSFRGLNIQHNIVKFEELKSWAKKFYSEVI